jgi:hypothetical protein
MQVRAAWIFHAAFFVGGAMAFDRIRPWLQVRWFVTAAGAMAMLIIAGVLVWKVITAPHPLAQLTTRTGTEIPR